MLKSMKFKKVFKISNKYNNQRISNFKTKAQIEEKDQEKKHF